MKTVNWGIVSTGTIAQQFASDFKYSSGGRLIGVASRSLQKAGAFARDYQIPKAYGSYTEMFKDPQIDAVYIATPHNFHLENSLEALEAGKAILCEKPLTTSAKDAQLLVDTAKQKGLYLMEGLWTYFLPALDKIREWIDSDKLGAIHHVKASFGYNVPFDPNGRMYNPDLAGGALWDMGIYTIAMASWVWPHMPNHMQVYGHKASTGIEDDVTMIFEYAEGLAHLQTAFRQKLHNELLIIGDKGYARIHDFWRASSADLFVGEEICESYADLRKGKGFEYQISAVNQDLAQGRLQSEVVTHERSLLFQKLMDQVLEKIHGS